MVYHDGSLRIPSLRTERLPEPRMDVISSITTDVIVSSISMISSSIIVEVLVVVVVVVVFMLMLILILILPGWRRETCRPEAQLGRGDDAVGNPHRAQISQFELVELILLSQSDKQLPVEQFEAAVSQSTVPSPPLLRLRRRYAKT